MQLPWTQGRKPGLRMAEAPASSGPAPSWGAEPPRLPWAVPQRTRGAAPVSSQLTFMILSLCFGLVLKKTDTCT